MANWPNGLIPADGLRALAAPYLERLQASEPGQALLACVPEEHLVALLIQSDFAADRVCREPASFASAFASDSATLLDTEQIRSRFRKLQAVDVTVDSAAELRILRSRILVEILIADLCLEAAVDDVLLALSAAADAAIKVALVVSRHSMLEAHGVVRNGAGQAIELGVLAMGKLGGYELNFSSDIDIVFVYHERGTGDGRRELDAEAYFTRQARRFIRLLNEPLATGFVYRVDVRLRPFGDSGALVVSLDSLESYLTQHGRDWERYAYVKARLVNDDERLAGELEPLLKRFVYRRYLDYTVFDSLRDMKRMIEAEVRRKDMADNVKLGPGGIREIEFVVQSLQLVRGGAQHRLQQRSLLLGLSELTREGVFDDVDASQLAESYRFLRALENRIQALKDEQVHAIPDIPDTRARLAYSMGFDDYDGLASMLNTVRERVAAQFAQAVFRETGEEDDEHWRDLWAADSEDVARLLQSAGVADPAALAVEVSKYHRHLESRPLDIEARERLARLMPAVLLALADLRDPLFAWNNLNRVFDAILRRSAYMSLLIENHAALKRFVALAGRNTYLASELQASPALLDVLLDPPEELLGDDLSEELDAVMGQSHVDDAESALQGLTSFQRAARFQVAVVDVGGQLPIMKVSDRLTEIAQRVIDAALGIAWRECTEQFGMPPEALAAGGEPRFSVIGYGKLGGFELSYESDLDLVFLHDCDPSATTVGGQRQLVTEVFFTRLTRKLMHYLTYQTSVGPLYEVDVRLRPSGRSGMLVTTLTSFERYQTQDAWTWEHQALLRARPVAGADEVAAGFARIRKTTLTRHVRHSTLSEQVRRMRQRMRDELGKGDSNHFDLKQDRGGLADIEFLVQYLILAHAAQTPSLIVWPDNVRQLEALEQAGVLIADQAHTLTQAYLTLRAELHRRALEGRSRVAEGNEFSELRDAVSQLWRLHFQSD